MKYMTAVLVFSTVLSLSAKAEGVYSWVDKQGISQFTDTPTFNKKGEPVKIKKSLETPINADYIEDSFGVNCLSAAKNTTEIKKLEIKDKSSFIYQVLNRPEAITASVKRCRRDVKTVKGELMWRCAEVAKDNHELASCDA